MKKKKKMMMKIVLKEKKNNHENFNLNLRKVKYKNNTITPLKISDNATNKLIIRKD